MSNILALGPRLTTPLSTLAADLHAALAESSHDVHPQELNADLFAWQELRNAAFPPTAGAGDRSPVAPLPSPDTVQTLTLYYAQLTHVLTRIPPRTRIPFPWYPIAPPALASAGRPPTASASSSSSSAAQPLSLSSERLSTLYSLAYVHAALGASTRRTDEAGIRTALNAFQLAAGVLDLLHREVERARRHTPRTGSTEVAGEEEGLQGLMTEQVVGALRSLCLAQAQEVAWQKAVMDRLKNGTVAKVAMHAAQLYQQARDAAEAIRSTADVASFAFADDLTRHLAYKHAHFTAVAHYRRSLDDLGANRYGDELGRLRICDEVLREVGATKGKRGVPEAVVRDLKSLQSTISENLARATKDNDLIYLAAPTPAALLPPIVPFPLAKPLLAPELAESLKHLRQTPWLRALVPTRTRDALELWEDRKKVWFEDGCEKVTRRLDQEATDCLASLNLPAALEAVQQPIGVPVALLERSEHVQLQGGLAKLETMMKDVRRVAGVNRQLVDESQAMLQEEADVDASYRATYGTLRWTRPPSVEVSAPLVQRAEQLEAVLNAAAESDGLVRAKFGEWEEAIGVLDRGQSALEAAIPDSAAGSSSSSSRSPELQRATRDLRASLEDLTELRTDRDRLVAAARARSEQASIRPRLEAGAAGVGGRRQDAGEVDGEGGEAEVAVLEEMLTEELEKLGGPFERELKQNRARQEDLLDQIKQQNSAFLATSQRQATDSQEREAAIRVYEAAAGKFDEMLGNLREGLKFYADLSRLLGELRDAVKAHVHARELEARAVLQALESQQGPPQPSEDPEPEPIRSGEEARQPRPARSPAVPQSEPAPEAAPPTPRRKSARSPVKRRPVQQDEPSGATPPVPQSPQPAPSGWDPSQGIRFG
ncbi:hypothetical protein JCM8202_000980 [Rhodotorula sphaerocarpa]